MSFFKEIASAAKVRLNQKFKRIKNLLWVSRCPGVWQSCSPVFLTPPVEETERAPFHASFHEPETGGRGGSARREGSASLEAALAAPVFLFFFGNLLILLLAYGTYSKNLIQLHQTGKALAAAACEQDGGEDIIRLRNSFVVKPAFPLALFPKGVVMNGCYLHKWNGYDLSRNGVGSDTEMQMVYVTKNGRVYHRDAGCSHLQLSIETVSCQEAAKARNQEGARYFPCERCGKGTEKNGGTVYITAEGNRYHGTLSCSGLKRTVYSVPLSRVGDLPPCSRCGG